MSAEAEPRFGEMGAIVAKVNLAADGSRILRLHMNRPEKRNALTLAMLEELHRCLSQKVDTILLTSAGPSFCAGLDLDECRNDSSWPRPMRHLELLASVYRSLLSSPAIVITFVQGFAVGGGVGLAVCADAVIAASNVRLRLPADGELASLARIVQPVVEARQIARRGSVAWQAGELDSSAAQTAGLIDQVLVPMEFATLRDQASRGIFSRSMQVESWRTLERRENTGRALRAILASLSH